MPKIRRLRASETTFKAKVTPQAQPISINGRVVIRLHFDCYMRLCYEPLFIIKGKYVVQGLSITVVIRDKFPPIVS